MTFQGPLCFLAVVTNEQVSREHSAHVTQLGKQLQQASHLLLQLILRRVHHQQTANKLHTGVNQTQEKKAVRHTLEQCLLLSIPTKIPAAHEMTGTIDRLPKRKSKESRSTMEVMIRKCTSFVFRHGNTTSHTEIREHALSKVKFRHCVHSGQSARSPLLPFWPHTSTLLEHVLMIGHNGFGQALSSVQLSLLFGVVFPH